MHLLRDDAELANEIGNPPFVFLKQIGAKEFSHQTPIAHQGADPQFGKAAAAVGWNETFHIQLRSNWPAVESFLMKLCHSIFEALEVFQLFEAAYWTSYL